MLPIREQFRIFAEFSTDIQGKNFIVFTEKQGKTTALTSMPTFKAFIEKQQGVIGIFVLRTNNFQFRMRASFHIILSVRLFARTNLFVAS
jgi:hypothetical protein